LNNCVGHVPSQIFDGKHGDLENNELLLFELDVFDRSFRRGCKQNGLFR
jgi:hypothetical protein